MRPYAGVRIISAEELDLPTVWDKMAADKLLGGGFAGAVFANKSIDGADGNGHVQIIDRVQSAKALG